MIKFLNRIFFISLVVISLLFIFKDYHPLNKNDYSRILQNNEIKIVTRFGPSDYYEIKSEENGYTYDVMKGFADFIGVKLTVITMDSLEDAINALNNREVDILANMGITNNVKTSYAYNKVNQYIVYNSKYTTKPNEINDLNGNDIEIIDSIIIKNNLDSFLKSIDMNLIISKEKNIDEIINLIKDNKVKYTVLNNNELAIFNKYFPEIKIGFTIGENIPSTWAIPENTNHQLEEQLSEYFTQILKTNKLKKFYTKHFTGKLQYTFVGTRSFLADFLNVFPLYEFYFKKYAKLYNHDWRLLASIGYQESKWDKDAVSYTGVRGLMMLTKNTSKEMNVEDREDPIQSIEGGAKYLKKMLRNLPDNINNDDKIWYAIASYNIGFRHIEDAMKMADNEGVDSGNWYLLEPYILRLSQSKYYKNTKYGYARGWETLKYVQNIRQYYDILVFLDSQDNNNETKQKDKQIPSTL
ncbi:MAG: membrane-bound lytic murein transglycosylase MltF [Gammaproteobacteria bacterium]|nr:membrane-bound lytic murein transglycosylase MltF [Gammaproteobacteria bacterium]